MRAGYDKEVISKRYGAGSHESAPYFLFATVEP